MKTYVHPEVRNIAKDLDEDLREEIAKEVIENYETDEESRQEWLSMHADWLKLYFQKDRAQNPPWEGSSTESVPMLAEACNQFHARAYQNMFPNNEIITAVPIGKMDTAAKSRAERVATHMSWQLLVQDPDYKRDKDRLLLSMPLHGSCFTKTYWDPVRKRNVVENVRASDLVVPYGTGPRDLADLERKTEIIWMPMFKAKIYVEAGVFLDMPEPYDQDTRNEVDKAEDDAQGIQETAYRDRHHAKILQQHCWLDLDGDDLDEPYIVTVDATSEKMLGITIRWETDELGNPTNGKQPVEYYTHYPFIDNPDGFYGLGMGHLIGPINTAVNKLVRQVIDSSTLANVGNHSGFINKQLGVKKGESPFQLGKFVPIDNIGDDIRRNIFTFQFQGPQPAHIQAIQLLMSRGDRLASVTEALTGQTEAVMQPTTVMALIDQGLQQFSSSYERVLHSWGEELQKLYRLNRKHLDPVEYFTLLDQMGTQDIRIAREDYEDDLQIRPLADPKMTTAKKKMAKAEAVLQFAMTNPLVMNSPQHFYNASQFYLRQLEIDNIDEFLPRPETMLPRVDDPNAENLGAMGPQPQMPTVYPDQDHKEHIAAHLQFSRDPATRLSIGDAGMAELDRHIQAHERAMVGLTIMQAQNAGIGSPGMVSGPGNAMGAPGGNGALQTPGTLAPGDLIGGSEPPERAI